MVFFKRFKARRLQKKLGLMIKHREQNAVSDTLLAKEIALCYRLASLYKSLIGCKKEPYAKEMQLESYRLAANINDTRAYYLVGSQRLEDGKFWQSLSEGDFSSDYHQMHAKEAFKEAFNYLEMADNNDYALARRQIGMAFINGWGKEVDKDKGFKMVVESIDKLNEWPKVTEVFKSLDLNKPEFYEQLTNLRKGDG